MNKSTFGVFDLTFSSQVETNDNPEY